MCVCAHACTHMHLCKHISIISGQQSVPECYAHPIDFDINPKKIQE